MTRAEPARLLDNGQDTNVENLDAGDLAGFGGVPRGWGARRVLRHDSMSDQLSAIVLMTVYFGTIGFSAWLVTRR